MLLISFAEDHLCTLRHEEAITTSCFNFFFCSGYITAPTEPSKLLLRFIFLSTFTDDK